MEPGDHTSILFWAFGVVWVALGIVGFLVFHVGRDVERKERWHPPFVVGSGVLFAGFVLATGPRDWFLLLILPFLALITWLNLRMTRFCHRCGRTVYQQIAFRRPQFCAHCGEALTGR